MRYLPLIGNKPVSCRDSAELKFPKRNESHTPSLLDDSIGELKFPQKERVFRYRQMPLDDALADANFPLFPVDPRSDNPGTPCFYNMGTFWTFEAPIPHGFDWKRWVQALPKNMYGGPVVLMNVKDGNVPHITTVPGGGGDRTADVESRLLRAYMHSRSCTGGMSLASMEERLKEFNELYGDRVPRMCEGCRIICMDGEPQWKKKCRDCYYRTKNPTSTTTGPRTCGCGASLEGMEHWKTKCLPCFKKDAKRRARFAPY